MMQAKLLDLLVCSVRKSTPGTDTFQEQSFKPVKDVEARFVRAAGVYGYTALHSHV